MVGNSASHAAGHSDTTRNRGGGAGSVIYVRNPHWIIGCSLVVIAYWLVAVATDLVWQLVISMW
jgi:hypothetical protein